MYIYVYICTYICLSIQTYICTKPWSRYIYKKYLIMDCVLTYGVSLKHLFIQQFIHFCTTVRGCIKGADTPLKLINIPQAVRWHHLTTNYGS